MKNLKRSLTLACICAVSFILVCCKGSGGEDYRTILPDDAFMTIGLNAKQLTKKANCGDIESSVLYRQAVAALSMSDIDNSKQEQILSILKDPANAGIDIDKDIYISMGFGENTTIYSPKVHNVMLLPIKNKSKFDKFISLLTDLSEGELTKTKEGSLNVVPVADSYGSSALIAYRDNAVAIAMATGSYDELVIYTQKLFKQSAAQSILGRNGVSDILSKNNDIKTILSLEGMSSMYEQMLGQSLPMMDAMDGTLYVMVSDFEKGRIHSEMKTIFRDKKAQEDLERLYNYSKKQTGALTRYIPANSLMTVGMGIEGKGFYETLSQFKQYAFVMAMPQVKQIIEAIEGDFIINVYDFNAEKSRISIIAQVNDNRILDQIAPLLGERPGKSELSVSMMGFNGWIGLKDGILYATMDPQVREAFNGGSIKAIDSQAATYFNGHVSGLVFDFGRVNDAVKQFADPQTAFFAGTILGLFDNMVAVSDADYTGTFDVNMTDKDTNALESICATVGSLIAMVGGMMM